MLFVEVEPLIVTCHRIFTFSMENIVYFAIRHLSCVEDESHIDLHFGCLYEVFIT